MQRNDLPAAEVKRRGMAAIEERLKLGPVHLIKRNRTAAVVLSEEDYLRLTAIRDHSEVGASALAWLLSERQTGSLSKAMIDAELAVERSW